MLCVMATAFVFFCAALHAQSAVPADTTWKQLLARADSLWNEAQFDSALVLAKRALEITEREYGKEDTSVADALMNIGDAYLGQSKYNDAEPYYQRALRIREQALGPDHPDVASTLNNLALLYADQGRYTEAESHMKRALTIDEKISGPDHPNVARDLNNLANLYWIQGRYSDAESLHRRVLTIRESSLSSDSPDLASSLNNLAILCMVQGRYREAEPLYRRALGIYEHAYGSDHPSSVQCMNNLSLLLAEEGRYKDAEPLCARALEAREKTLGPNHPDVAQSLHNLASLYQSQGRYVVAEALYGRALAIYERALGFDHPSIAQSLNNLALLYLDMGRYSDAEPVYMRALSIREKALGLDHPDVAQSLNNLALLHVDQGRYAEAEALHKRALAIREKSLGSNHPDVAASLNNLAVLYQKESRFADAEPLVRQALAICEKVLGSDHPDVATKLHNLAALHKSQGRHAESELLYKRALAIREKAFGVDHPDVAELLSDLGLLYNNRSNHVAAANYLSRAWHIRRQNFRDGATVLAERNALEYSQFLSTETSNYLSVLMDFPDGAVVNAADMARVVLSTKSQVTDGIMARNRAIVQETDPEVVALSDTLKWARFALSNLYVSGPDEKHPESFKDKLQKATAEKERLEAELVRRNASFATEEGLWDVDATKIALALPAGGALVEFMKYDHSTGFSDVEERYLAVVVTSSGDFAVFPLGSAAVMDSVVSEYRDYFQHPAMMDAAGHASVSSAIYQRVWQPFASLLEGASTVFIAPDGDLNLVSFAGLADETGQYLIEKYPLHYLSTGRDLIRLQESAPSNSGLLAMGDPDFDMSPGMSTASALGLAVLVGLNLRSSCDALNKLNAVPLPGTRQEVELVATQWRNSGATAVTYFGSDATEEQFKQNAPGKRVIHLATHGFYISEDCQKTLNTRSAFGMQEGGYVGENPLLLSGLLLAGANRHGEGANEAKREDGIVTAEEVAGLNLSGTDLVVLSACETGLGEVKSGEGVYGLRRAFQMAGARTVISALWPIDDRATAEFMGQLFSARNEDLPHIMQRIALNRISALRSQNRSDNPFFWAGFVATGDWKTH
jgi:tetratricopeptide (TPR) repeat protein/CHAT domain-containing protein